MNFNSQSYIVRFNERSDCIGAYILSARVIEYLPMSDHDVSFFAKLNVQTVTVYTTVYGCTDLNRIQCTDVSISSRILSRTSFSS